MTQNFIGIILTGIVLFILIAGLLVAMGYGLRWCYREICHKCGLTKIIDRVAILCVFLLVALAFASIRPSSAAVQTPCTNCLNGAPPIGTVHRWIPFTPAQFHAQQIAWRPGFPRVLSGQDISVDCYTLTQFNELYANWITRFGSDNVWRKLL